ncbi:serine/threonine-protein kinase [Botrimarina hoheduenensis]|nr:serine/threonine-protein kinase [Botrimarina hoheduenensis]
MKRSPEADAAAAPGGEKDAAEAADSPRRERGRFLYRTGDRPLEGYTIKRGVGHGGFGEVYFATSDAGKEVALKLIRRNLDIELRGVRQCLNLKHPNLISLYDIRTDAAGDEWVVMEFVPGESLEQAIQRHPTGMPVEEALAWFRGVAAGVGHLHRCGIVHRDLKPGNLFLERPAGEPPRAEDVRIGDYGLSKFISTSRRSGQTESVGTVHYMAPEIAGGRYGREIDTYALGVILYEMLTGRTPFEGESVGEVLMKHLTAEPDLSRLGEPYRSVVARALTKDPELRVSSVEQMIAMLPGTGDSGQPVAPVAAALPGATPAEPPPVWSPVSRPPHTHHPKPAGEPLWQGFVELTNTARTRWNAWDAPPLLKGLLLFAGVSGFFVSGAFMLPMAILPFYFLYYLVWAMFFDTGTATGATPFAEGAKPNAKRARFVDWRKAALAARRDRPLRTQARTLVGSMIVATLVSGLAAAVAAPWLVTSGSPDTWAVGAWFATVGVVGAWSVLIVNALVERARIDGFSRRYIQLLAGGLVGATAFGTAQLLKIELPYNPDSSIARNSCVLENAFDIDLYKAVERSPDSIAVPLTASMAYFGAIFFLLKLGKNADYLRRKRVGIGAVASAGIGAWAASFLCWYPQPIGLVVAGIIAFAVQIASPWLSNEERVRLAKENL